MSNASNRDIQAIDNDILNADTLHQACIINKRGEEVPITRDMINRSCELLESIYSTEQPMPY